MSNSQSRKVTLPAQLPLLLVVALAAFGLTANASAQGSAKYTTHVLNLPSHGKDNITNDYITYDARTNEIWVPAINIGSVYVIDVRNEEIHEIKGFATKEISFPNGRTGVEEPSGVDVNGYTETCHTDQANAFKSKWSWFSERGPKAHGEHQQGIGGTGPAKQPVQTQAAPTHHCGLRDEDDHPRIEHGTMDAKECHEPMWALGMEQAIAHRSAEAIGDQRQHQQRHGEVEHAGLAGALPPVARRAVRLGHVKHPIAP